MDLLGLSSAVGLRPDDIPKIRELVRVHNKNLPKHQRRVAYYDDRVKVKNLGIICPSKFKKNLRTNTGWAAKAVDMLAQRSTFDGFTFSTGENAELNAILAANDFGISYQMAVPSELVQACGFWTVSKGGQGEPAVIINYHDAMSSAAVWDYRHKRIDAGLVIEDFKKFNGIDRRIPSLVMVHLSDYIIEIERTKTEQWVSKYIPHSMGRPMIEPMVYHYRNDRPFGKSRISRAVMRIIDSMQREIQRTEFHSECFSSPQKYLFGLTEEQYEALEGKKSSTYMTELLLATRDEDGNNPDFGMLQQASMSPHLELMDKLANQMASETSLPVASFGVAGNGYTSSDALRASTDDLVIEAQTLNASNGKALENIARMALAVLGNKSYSELTDDERSVTVHWKDPSMPSTSAMSDAMLKQVSAVPEFAGTDVFWEKLGYTEDERVRIANALRKAKMQNMLTEALNTESEDNGGNTSFVPGAIPKPAGSIESGGEEDNPTSDEPVQ